MILASICQDTSDELEKNNTCVTSEHVEDKSESAKQSLEESAKHVVKKDSKEVTPSQPENTDVNISPKSVIRNGVACVGEDNALTDSKSHIKKEDADCSNHSQGLNISGHEFHDDLDTEKVDSSKQKTEQATKRRQKKSSSSTKSAKPSKGQVAAKEKETEKILDYESNCKKGPSSPHRDHSIEEAWNNESEVVASPPSESLYDVNQSREHERTKKKDSPVTAEDVSKVSGGASDSEAKPVRRSVTKALGQKSDVKKTGVVDSVKKGSGAANDADAKKHSAKKLDENKNLSGGSSSKQMEDKKKGRQGKANSETDVAKSSAMEVDKESDVKEYGENFVGLWVKVWWPDDREFFKGVIHSFDSAKKKHKVLYDDGDEEVLNLVKEKWKVIEADSDAEATKEERENKCRGINQATKDGCFFQKRWSSIIQ